MAIVDSYLQLLWPMEELAETYFPNLRCCPSHSSSSKYLSNARDSKPTPLALTPVSLHLAVCKASSSGSSANVTYALATRQSVSFVSICSRFSARSRTRLDSASGSARGAMRPGRRRAADGNLMNVRVCNRCGVVLSVLGGRLLRRHSSYL